MIQKKCKMAFTLVEMLLVIVIIGVLAGTVVTSLSGRSQQAKITRAQADIRGSLALALDLFEQDTGRYPTAEEGIMALVRDPGVQGWQGPYLKGGIKADPWGNQYIYQLDSSQTGLYKLSSAGPDGQHGTEDDIREEETENPGKG
jgi:general secretion pathway protein G